MLSQPLQYLRKNAKSIALSGLPIATAFVLIAGPVLAVTNQTGELNVTTSTDPYAIKAYNTNSASNSTGIFGVTFSSGSKAVYGYSAAQTGAPSFGVAGISQNGYGVYGSSYASGVVGIFGENLGTGGTAIQGNSSTGNGLVGLGGGNGVVGMTTNTGTGYAGVLGQDMTASVDNYGAEGTTNGGYGVVGIANGTGVGGYFGSNSNDAVDALTSSGAGVYGSSGSSEGVFGASGSGYGVRATSSSNYALNAYSSTGNGAVIQGGYIGIVGRAPASGGFPIDLTDQNANNLFYVTGTGDVYYHGTLNAFAARAGGGSATAFGPKTTAPTIEDIGTGSVVNGVATVKLDPTFAQTIDKSVKYHVFLTPQGDTRGLFIASKSAAGFVVKECQGGRGSFDFDYRVVGTPIGNTKMRMQAVTSAMSVAAAPRATVPKTLAARKPRDLRGIAPKTGQIIRVSPALTTPGLSPHRI